MYVYSCNCVCVQLMAITWLCISCPIDDACVEMSKCRKSDVILKWDKDVAQSRFKCWIFNVVAILAAKAIIYLGERVWGITNRWDLL